MAAFDIYLNETRLTVKHYNRSFKRITVEDSCMIEKNLYLKDLDNGKNVFTPYMTGQRLNFKAFLSYLGQEL